MSYYNQNYIDESDYVEREPKKKQISFKLPWKKTTKKTVKPKNQIKMRNLEQQQKQDWNSSYTQSGGLFDNKLSKNTLRNEKYNKYKQDDFDENQLEKLNRKTENRENDNRTKTSKILQDKMDRQRVVYESYHTLAQVQELTKRENDRKNANVLGKHKKELEQLKWMIENEDQKKMEADAIQQERYQKLLEQKQLNLQLKKKIQNQEAKGVQQVVEKDIQVYQQQPKLQVLEKNPPAEYIEGVIWEKEVNLPKQGIIDIHDQSEQLGQNDGAQKHSIFQRKQNEKNKQFTSEIAEIQREQAKRNYEIDNLIALHQEKLAREKELQNHHFLAIQQRVNKLKGAIDPLDEKMSRLQDEDRYKGNLLSKATAKMIQVYEEKLTDLIIDDLLYETVGILQEEEEREKKRNQKIKREAVVRDYIEEFKNLVVEQEEIEFQLGRKFKPYDFFNGVNAKQRNYLEEPLFVKYIGIEMGMGIMVDILEHRNKFSESLYKLSHYSKKNLEVFRILTEELIDEILMEETIKIDKSNDEFAQALFQNEFK
ncbi:hypothetical protein PPERSA_07462 [Pseudocohnilembus persalinus]|uniref:Uncharacterized protein n=1 Tax=Pseudocohnilembus persalinus TaxID=266149 RepID=A0A0V0QAG3_PSEPJ|nr:hypothetical protein PPERSA_07462 [Pseudocohnilembus persalinus]|eukprot:KRW99219.1 hypothetical protein PPERSA_07462 [Pseudocohnilembus persalinus]